MATPQSIKMKLIILASVFQIIFCDWSLEPKQVNYLFKRTECNHFNPKFIVNVTCRHKFSNRSTIDAYVELFLQPGLKINKLEIKTYKKFGTVYRPILIKHKEDFCAIVGNKTNSYLSQQLWRIFSGANTNFLEPCPLTGRKFSVSRKKGSPSSVASMPPLIPIGDWKFIYKFTTFDNGPEELIIAFADVYEVTQKSAIQF